LNTGPIGPVFYGRNTILPAWQRLAAEAAYREGIDALLLTPSVGAASATNTQNTKMRQSNAHASTRCTDTAQQAPNPPTTDTPKNR